MGETYLFNYEDGTPKSLYDSLSFITGLLQDSYKFPIISYQEIAGLLSRDYKTPINFLLISYKSPINLFSRDYSTPVNLL